MNFLCTSDEAAVLETDGRSSTDAALECQLDQWLECMDDLSYQNSIVQSFVDTLQLDTCLCEQHVTASASRPDRRRETEMNRLIRFGWTRAEVTSCDKSKRKRYVYTNKQGIKIGIQRIRPGIAIR